MSNMPKRKIQYSQRSAFWPCGACRGNCAKDSVECSSCSQWFHYSCENLSEEDVKKLQGTTPFTCFQCLRLEVDSSKGYSFPATLVRLMTVVSCFMLSIVLSMFFFNLPHPSSFKKNFKKFGSQRQP